MNTDKIRKLEEKMAKMISDIEEEVYLRNYLEKE